MARILIVEDESLVSMSLAFSLEAEGHEVREASDGRAAIRIIEGGFTPDLVTTDLMMPRMDGAELVAALRATPERVGLRIVMMSAIPEAVLAPREIAYDAFVGKPFIESQVVLLIAEMLRA